MMVSEVCKICGSPWCQGHDDPEDNPDEDNEGDEDDEVDI